MGYQFTSRPPFTVNKSQFVIIIMVMMMIIIILVIYKEIFDFT